jgi:hypothetical protein
MATCKNIKSTYTNVALTIEKKTKYCSVMDVFIFEPFKLMAVAMLFICLLGRPVKFIDTPALVNQESDGNCKVFFMISVQFKSVKHL